jgi:transcriptional regulator with XRE-family HTH domain
MNQGHRLKEERERLGFNQTDFAAIASASKHSQINWEKGASSPNSAALEAWASVGLDVLYVVLGRRTTPVEETLSPRALAHAQNFEALSDGEKRTLERVVDLAAKQENSPLLKVSA